MQSIRNTLAASVVAVAALGSSSVQAGPVIGTIPDGASNEFINTFVGRGMQIEGWYGASLYLTGVADVTVEYFGAEAGFRNRFNFGGTTVSHGGGNTFVNVGPSGVSAVDAKQTFTKTGVAAGLLNFSFGINGAASTFTNATNPDNIGWSPNFFATFDDGYKFDTVKNGITAGGGQSVFLFLDDGGAGPDDNHDDFVVRLSVTGATIQRVPEPGSLALAGIALAGLGAASRKRRPSR